MTLLMVLCAVNFIACKKDAPSIDYNMLEGVWMLTHSKGWESTGNQAEKKEWDETYDPDILTESSQRVIIRQISENRFSFIYGEYLNHKWYDNSPSIVYIEGNTIIDSEYGESLHTSIESLSSNQLIIRETYSVEKDEHIESGDITNTYVKR